MYQGLGNLLGGGAPYPYSQSSVGSMGGGNGLLGGLLGNNGSVGSMGGGNGLMGGLLGNNGFLQGGVRCSQNEDRLFQEKAQRNLLKKYLTQATGDPIQSSLISSTIPGKGALDDFDVGLGTKSSIISKLAGSLGPQAFSSQNNNILGSIGSLASSNNGLLNSLVGGNNNNAGLLSSLVSLASTPNNNGNILSSLGGLGTGLLGGNSSGGSGLLGSIQSGINTLNTLNKVNNAVSGIKGIFA